MKLLLAVVLTAGLAAVATADQDYFDLRNGLAHTPQVIQKTAKARVAFLGGSITQMTGWRDLVCADLRNRFPGAELDFVAAGIASMGSTPGAFRLERDVFARGPVDLLFVEAAVNDSTNARTPQQMIRGMEGIVRHAKRINPDIDILFMHFVDPGKMEAYNRGETPVVIAQHEAVAAYYGLPSLNLAREVTDRIRAEEFTWEEDFKDLHPSPFGHEIYRASIARLLDAAWKDQGASPGAPPFPAAPMDPFSYANPAIVPIADAVSTTFQEVSNWEPADGKGTRAGFTKVPMLVAESPGAELTLRFDGTAVGIWVAAGPDAGKISYQIDGNPERMVDLFTPWSASLHLPWAYILDDELPAGSHVLRLTVMSGKNPGSAGTAVRIAHFLVNRPEP